jgi:hypothetical protein
MAYLLELLETSGEYIEYWEDTQGCSSDARVVYEENDPMDDGVAIPNQSNNVICQWLCQCNTTHT